jgi:hypothetical protein
MKQATLTFGVQLETEGWRVVRDWVQEHPECAFTHVHTETPEETEVRMPAYLGPSFVRCLCGMAEDGHRVWCYSID